MAIIMTIKSRGELKNNKQTLSCRFKLKIWLKVCFLFAGAYGVIMFFGNLVAPLLVWLVTGVFTWHFNEYKVLIDILFGMFFGFVTGSLMMLYEWWMTR
jgi:TctA family transporter